jgi:hypothetical protein
VSGWKPVGPGPVVDDATALGRGMSQPRRAPPSPVSLASASVVAMKFEMRRATPGLVMDSPLATAWRARTSSSGPALFEQVPAGARGQGGEDGNHRPPRCVCRVALPPGWRVAAP